MYVLSEPVWNHDQVLALKYDDDLQLWDLYKKHIYVLNTNEEHFY